MNIARLLFLILLQFPGVGYHPALAQGQNAEFAVTVTESAAAKTLFPTLNFVDCNTLDQQNQVICVHSHLKISFYSWNFLHSVVEFPIQGRLLSGDLKRLGEFAPSYFWKDSFYKLQRSFFATEYLQLAECLKGTCKEYIYSTSSTPDAEVDDWINANEVLGCLSSHATANITLKDKSINIRLGTFLVNKGLFQNCPKFKNGAGALISRALHALPRM